MRPGNRTSARAAADGVAAAFELAAPLHQLSRVPERCAQVLERARTTSGHLQLGMLAIASMAASECAASSASSGPPQAAPARAFPCGSAITGHIASSSPHDQIHPSISTVSCSAHNITVSYAISSPYRDEGIPAPFGPTPPTALLIDAGKIVASQVTQPQAIPSGTVNGQDAQFAFVGKIPYRDALTFTELCPGTTWRQTGRILPSIRWRS